MISRTLLEWDKLPYGEHPTDQIPDAAAGRIARVAAVSPLAGRGERGVLEHGRHFLRARGVVGVVAAPGATLEILPKICFGGEASEAPGPAASHARIRRQLVHMLGVALDLRIEAGEVAALDSQRETLLDLLIRLFADRLADAVRRGMPRAYVTHEDDLPALRGRLDVMRQFTRHAANPSRIACRYDALSGDVALNRIMKATVTRLSAVARSADTQRTLRELAFAYADVADVAPSALRFDAVILDRTSERWRTLLALAKLLLGDRFQTTSGGASPGWSLLFEMNMLFERYVTAMLRRTLAPHGLSVVAQGGRLFCLTDASGAARFQTKPDILVKRGDATIAVIDTKWKAISARIDDPKQGISQGDVYQMMAYGRLYGCSRLMLLYPHHDGLPKDAGRDVYGVRLDGCGDTLTVASLDVGSHGTARAGLATLVEGMIPDLVANPG